MSLTETTRPIRSLVNWRIVIGVLLIVAAIGGGVVLSRRSDSSISVLSAARDLAVSSPVSPGDLAAVSVTIPESSRGQLIAASEVAEAAGLYPLRPLKAGELISRSAFSNSPLPFHEVALAIPPETPLDSRLVAGARVDIVATLDKGSSESRTVVLARDAEIVEISTSGDSSSMISVSSRTVVVGVKPPEALAVIYAMHNGEIALIRTAGSTSVLPAEVSSENLGGVQ